MKSFRKQPGDHLDYTINLSNWLAEGDEIEAVDVSSPPGIQVTQRDIARDNVKVWVKGGTSGQSYKITVTITTESRVKEVEFLMTVVEL